MEPLITGFQKIQKGFIVVSICGIGKGLFQNLISVVVVNSNHFHGVYSSPLLCLHYIMWDVKCQ
nr:MAG TPA: hypothetical protein [Caudoviricetes sp.]